MTNFWVYPVFLFPLLSKSAPYWVPKKSHSLKNPSFDGLSWQHFELLCWESTMQRTWNCRQLNCLIKRTLGPIWCFSIKHFWILYPSRFYVTGFLPFPLRNFALLSSLCLLVLTRAECEVWHGEGAASQPFRTFLIRVSGKETLLSPLEHLVPACQRKHLYLCS